MKKMLFLLAFILVFSFVSAEEIPCTKVSETYYTGTFTSNQFCLIPVLGGKAHVKVGVNDVSFASSGVFSFPFYAFFEVEPEVDPQGLFKDNKLDCGAWGTDNWVVVGSTDSWFGREETVCDTQRGMFWEDVDLVTLAVPDKPSSKNLKIEINLEGDEAFRHYLSLVLGRTVNEIDFRTLSMQFSVFQNDSAGKTIAIKNGNIETETELRSTKRIGSGNNAVFDLVKNNQVLCEINVSFDSGMNPVQCGSLGEVTILFDEKETEKYTEDKTKGKELFFNLSLKVGSSEEIVTKTESIVPNCAEGKITEECLCGTKKVSEGYCCDNTPSDIACDQIKPACKEDWVCTAWSACVNGQQTRTCTDKSDCGTTKLKPETTSACQENGTTANLTVNQQNMNKSIFEFYYGQIFKLPSSKWPVEK